MWVPAWRRALIQFAGFVLAISCVFAGAGCKHDDSADMTMPADKLKAITDADRLISTGQTEIQQGQDLKDKDSDASARLIKQGEDDETKGQAMLNQAKMMK